MRKALYLILILLFPSIIYLLFSLGEHHVERLRFYGDHLLENGDTVYLPAPLPVLADPSGVPISPTLLKGKVLLVDLFDWPCDETCKTKMATLANYLNKVGLTDKWVLLSIGVNDSMSQQGLSGLAQKHLYEGDNWIFARSSDSSSLVAFLDYCYVKTGRVKSISELPSAEFMILDGQGRIRGYFDSRIYKDNKKMEDAIKLLIKEPHLSWKDQ